MDAIMFIVVGIVIGNVLEMTLGVNLVKAVIAIFKGITKQK